MKKLIITADSGCDIGVFKNSDIPTATISSYIISNSGNQYKDIIEINNEEIYKMVEQGEKFNTSAPNVEDFEKFFSGLLQEYEFIIHFTISSNISLGNTNNSHFVADKLNKSKKRIYIIDSRQVSCGGKLACYMFMKILEKNTDIQRSIDIFKNSILNKIVYMVIVPNATGFIESGRNLSELKASQKWKLHTVKILQKLGVKFQITVKDGKLVQSGFKRFSGDKVFVEFFKNHISQVGLENISDECFFYGTSFTKNENCIRSLEEYVKGLNYFKHIERKDLSSVVGCFVCEDTFFFSYLKK